MNIQCPICREEIMVEVELEVGQHVACPYCSQKFSYEQSLETSHEVERPQQIDSVENLSERPERPFGNNPTIDVRRWFRMLSMRRKLMIVGVMAVGLLALVNVCVSGGDSKLGGLFGENIGDVLKATEIETKKDGSIRIKKPIAEIPWFSIPIYEAELSNGRVNRLWFCVTLHDNDDKDAAVKLIREVKKRYGEPPIKEGDDFFSNTKELICKDGVGGVVSYWRNGVYCSVALSSGVLSIECRSDEDLVRQVGKLLAKTRLSKPEAYSKARDEIRRRVDASTLKRILKVAKDVENASSGDYL